MFGRLLFAGTTFVGFRGLPGFGHVAVDLIQRDVLLTLTIHVFSWSAGWLNLAKKYHIFNVLSTKNAPFGAFLLKEVGDDPDDDEKAYGDSKQPGYSVFHKGT
jgi:hypothetical protein